MGITSTQQGVITEAEFAKVVILTTEGALVPARPVADDDRRDYEIHIRRHFLESLAMQLKTAKRLRLHGRSRMLQINFRVTAPLVSDDRLWYFLAYFDVDEMRFIDPVFIVPSRFLHKHALHGGPRRHPAPIQGERGAKLARHVVTVSAHAEGARPTDSSDSQGTREAVSRPSAADRPTLVGRCRLASVGRCREASATPGSLAHGRIIDARRRDGRVVDGGGLENH
jgi:hypothetical protein